MVGVGGVSGILLCGRIGLKTGGGVDGAPGLSGENIGDVANGADCGAGYPFTAELTFDCGAGYVFSPEDAAATAIGVG